MPAAITHYHAPDIDNEGGQALVREQVFRRQSDADAYLTDLQRRAGISWSGITSSMLTGLAVRSCTTPACVGRDG